MARRVTQKMREHVQSEIDPLVKVFLITIYHDDLVEPIRVSSDNSEVVMETAENIIYGTISNGKTYYYSGFEACLANDEDGAPPQIQVTLPRAHRSIIDSIESMGAGPVTVDIQLVFADTPDIVELSITGMEMSEITYDESTVSGIISRDLLFTEPFPFRTFTPDEWPFLFKNRASL